MTAPPSPMLKQALHHLNWARSTLEQANLDAPELTPEETGDMSAATLLEACQSLLEASPICPQPVIRSLHHMACSGGTLIARILGAQANVRLLSEVNPFSIQLDRRQLFRPSDISFLARNGTRPVDQATVQALFEAEMHVLAKASHQTGHVLMLRDHAHSTYCLGSEPQKAPNLHSILTSAFPTRALVTTRHPLDCYLSLHANGWVHFKPATMDEYARRMGRFLHDHRDIAILRYEDMLTDPTGRLTEACEVLEVPFDPQTLALSQTITLSGDSGRQTDALSVRPRRPVPTDIRRMAARSPAYSDLCSRLGYAPAPDAPPVAGPLPHTDHSGKDTTPS